MIVEEVLNLKIVGLFIPSSYVKSAYICTIYNSELDIEIFREITEIPRHIMMTKYKDSSPEAKLQKTTFAKAKARILIGNYIAGTDYIQSYLKPEDKSSIPEDEIIKRHLLQALANIRRNHFAIYKQFDFEIDGFCEILGIDRGLLFFIIDLLKEEELISETEINNELKNNPIFITAKGYKYISNFEIRKPIMKGIENSDSFEYDIVISFAGEDRDIAEQIKNSLEFRKITVFYDDDSKGDLWGKNLYSHLAYIYGKAGKYCLMILSENYSKKLWTNHEREHAQARAFRENREYILPIRIDNTEIPGISETIGYIEYAKSSAEEIADLISFKLSKLRTM
ncbi:TIR domain-containing protein [Leptospira sp. 85282-16]|uniref:toll/interleukin-1 receptor domain-containing protein n=1 Tax=Leptospira sp. 85282-16 TaxID=2971256 RepID=UPI0021C04F4E|nr:TIR domain-containing protein [Leptospira sp. 85282-16]MCT8335888.1 TIR domain-containing protein [Leptospira sp. 85282-16]